MGLPRIKLDKALALAAALADEEIVRKVLGRSEAHRPEHPPLRRQRRLS